MAADVPPRSALDVLRDLKQRAGAAGTGASHAERAKARLAAPEPQDSPLPARITDLLSRAFAHSQLGDRPGQMAVLQRALATAGTNGVERFRVLGNLYGAEADGGSLLSARDHANAMVETARSIPAGHHIWALTLSIYIHSRLGDRAAAERTLGELDYMLRQARRWNAWPRYGENWTSMLERSRAVVYELQGNLAAAEASAQTALGAAERYLAMQVDAAGPAQRDEVAQRTGWIEVITRHLAAYQAGQGKLLAAELTTRKALQLTIDRTGFESGATARSLQLLARVLVEQGRYVEAEQVGRQAIRSAEGAGLGPASEVFVHARGALGGALAMQGRWKESASVFAERVDQLAKADPALRKSLRLGDFNWALALVKTGQHERARGLLGSMRRSFESYGESAGASRLAYTRGILGLSYVEAGEIEPALVEFRASVPYILEHAFESQREDRDGPARLARANLILEGYLKALSATASAAPAQDVVAELFRVADFARGSRVQRALSLGSARAAARDPGLRALVDEDERLAERVGTLSGLMADLANAPEEKRLGEVIARMRTELDDIDRRRADIRKRMVSDFPDFAELVAPKPVTLQDAAKALRPGEALLSLYVAEDRVYAWGIGRDRPVAFAVVEASRPALAAQIQRLRKALDVGDVPLERFPVFDVALAHELHARFVRPVESAFEGARTLLVAPHGSLAQIPFSLLVTAPATLQPGTLRFEEYRAVPWLLKRHAIVQIPAVSSLMTLARLEPPKGERHPFVGYGDPFFSKAQAASGGTSTRGVRLRNLAVTRDTASAAVAGLPPLPDTRDEVRDIARALRADPDKDVYLGPEASRRNIDDQHLRGRRVVAFATHGLVPGDLDGLTQPALALSSSEVTGVANDGLLTMEDILGLRIDADWVVLSACNTAAAGADGEEAVSGLGRAFFFAGARAVLASGWPVETVSAKLLTTGLFRRQADDPKLSRAEALRLSMLELVERGATPQFAYAHPMFWAPFGLYGDGG